MLYLCYYDSIERCLKMERLCFFFLGSHLSSSFLFVYAISSVQIFVYLRIFLIRGLKGKKEAEGGNSETRSKPSSSSSGNYTLKTVQTSFIASNFVLSWHFYVDAKFSPLIIILTAGVVVSVGDDFSLKGFMPGLRK